MTKILLRLAALVLTVAIGVYLYQQGQKPSEARPFAPYRLDELASKPIPKANFLTGVHFYAKPFCRDKTFLELLKTDEESCRTTIAGRQHACLETLSAIVPEEFSDRERLNEYASRYIRCVTNTDSP